jgi:hypothetical protein
VSAKVQKIKDAWWVVIHHEGRRRKRRYGPLQRDEDRALKDAAKIGAQITAGALSGRRTAARCRQWPNCAPS